MKQTKLKGVSQQSPKELFAVEIFKSGLTSERVINCTWSSKVCRFAHARRLTTHPEKNYRWNMRDRVIFPVTRFRFPWSLHGSLQEIDMLRSQLRLVERILRCLLPGRAVIGCFDGCVGD